MTPKQILDSFSETLMQDERILSAQERALLVALLQHAKASSNASSAMQEAVRAVIASAVGETVAQRGFSILGGSIVERILQDNQLAVSESSTVHSAEIYAGPNPGGSPSNQPQPPGNQPQPPGIALHKHEQPQPPGTPMRGPGPPRPQPQPPGNQPQPPGVQRPEPAQPARQPQPPGHGTRTTVVLETNVAVDERPSTLPARCVVLDEFLAPQELEELTRYVVEHEADFRASEVVSPVADGGLINYEHRRSRVLFDLGQHQELVLARIRAVLPQALEKLGMEQFAIAGVEVQVTASNDGDFFRCHNDNGSDRVAARHLTFVYFFHREPRQFEGGELRLYDERLEGDSYVSQNSYRTIVNQTIVPQQNQIVFFPCELMHEITAVKCPSGLFADSRFTLNGWLHR